MTKPYTRKPPKTRKSQILLAAIKVAKAKGLDNISQYSVAEAAGCTAALVRHYYRDIHNLKNAVAERAIAQDSPRLIVEAILIHNRTPLPAVNAMDTTRVLDTLEAYSRSLVGSGL